MVTVSIEVIESSDEAIKVRLKGIDRTYANAIRRFAISEVPCMAIDEVVILENSSVMYDELLAHRLGLLPLKTDLDRYILPEQCDCRNPLGCSKCRVLLVLDAQSRDKVQTVYSGDLVSEDKEVVPIEDKIPIVKLVPGQKIKLEAYAKLGKGKDHAKWQPVSASVLTETNKENEFDLCIDSVGSLPASAILAKAAETLHSKLEDFSAAKGLA